MLSKKEWLYLFKIAIRKETTINRHDLRALCVEYAFKRRMDISPREAADDYFYWDDEWFMSFR